MPKVDYRLHLPRFIILAGVVFTGTLLALAPDGVFYNGDGGIKFILILQMLGGYCGPDILPPVDPASAALWQRGYFPFGEPFVYEIDGRFVQCFPIVFSLLSAPFYYVMGFRGLYVLPLISLWATWLVFARTCRRLEVGPLPTSLGLFTLISCSPLTIYGVTFWEHTLAVFLAFLGFSQLLPFSLEPLASADGVAREDAVAARDTARARRRLAAKRVLAGMALGLAGWLRPENLCFGAAALFTRILTSGAGKATRWAITGFVATFVGFMALNWFLYRHPLGAHSFSTLRGMSFLDHLVLRSAPLLLELNRVLIYHMPFALMLILFHMWLVWRLPLRSAENMILGTVILQSLLVPVIVIHTGGLQWGPRYLLSSVPLLTLGISLGMQRWAGAWRQVWLAVLPPCLAWGLYVNTWQGAETLLKNYRGNVLPALEFLQTRDERRIVTNSPYVAQGLAWEWPRRDFLYAASPTKMFRDVRQAGTERFLIVQEFIQDSPDRFPAIARVSLDGDERFEIRHLGHFGWYLEIFEARLARGK